MIQEETKPTRFPFLTMILVALAFAGGYLYGQSPIAPYSAFPGATTAVQSADSAEFRVLFEVFDLLNTRFLRQPLDSTVLIEGAINGMLETVEDQHTRYLSPEAQAAAQQSFEGEFQGIGAEVENIDGDITIVSPIDGSPAEAAGLQPGDIIRESDGVELTGMDISEAAALVRGPAGSTVNLIIERDGEQFPLPIVRGVIKLESVRGEILEENIAYIRLSNFGSNTDEDLTAMLDEFMAQSPDGLILDLRRNPGGSLDTVVAIADEFMDEGVVLYEEFGNGRRELFESNDDNDLAESIEIVVLVDEGSASASEVLAGAMQDRGRATVIGQTTFGKGTVQTWQPLSNGGGVRITIARWLTPNELSIHENGLDPDIFIPQPELTSDFEDAQLQAAIDYLQGEEVISIPPEPSDEAEEEE